MVVRAALFAGLSATSLIFSTSAAAFEASAQEATKASSASTQEQRICETITMTGSRLTKKKFCGTRAEWEDKKLQDRKVVEQIQTRLNGPCSTVNQHGGTPAC